MPGDSDGRRSWWERQQEKLLRKSRENPERQARLERSWFGRLMLRTAERTVEGSKPELIDDERIEFSTRAERVTIINQIVSGHLTLTDKRLIFTPNLEVSWIPWTIRTSEMPFARIRPRKGVFLSRGVHFKFFLGMMVLPGWIHFANLKVKQGRKAWWLRVEDPAKWVATISESSG